MVLVDIDTELLKQMCEATIKMLLEKQEALLKKQDLREAKEEEYVAARWYRKYTYTYNRDSSPWDRDYDWFGEALEQDWINDRTREIDRIQHGLQLTTATTIRISTDDLARLLTVPAAK